MKLISRLLGKAPLPPPTLQERISNLDERPTVDVLDAALNADDADLRAAARSRVAALVDTGAVDFNEFRRSAPSEAILAVAGMCKDLNRLSQALADAGDAHVIGQLALVGASSRLRQMAAGLVHDPAQLKQLLHQVRNKDRSVYRILKLRLEARYAAERKTALIEKEIGELCELLERHSHRPYDIFYQAILQGLKNRWNALATQPAADIELRVREAIERGEQCIAANLMRASQRAAEEAAVNAARELQEREQLAAQAAAAAGAQAQMQEEELQRARDAEERAAEARTLAERRDAREKLLRQLGGLIRMAGGAVRDGATQRAAGLRRTIAEKLSSDIELPAHLSRQLLQLDEKLHEFKQWKDYAVAPKRRELIAEMEALSGSGEDPRVLAEQIKSLQEQWRTINKGIISESPHESQRFQQAAQAAYQPCREYFDALAAQRQKNLDQRRAVLDRLLVFESAQAAGPPDWRLIDEVLREAPREWRRYFPVDREAVRALQIEWDAALGRLQAKLDGWHRDNVADKQALIQRARLLLAQEDGREAIDAVKHLQLSWKQTGPAPPALSQSLWNEFRETCDAVYQKRQQAHAEYAAGLEANKRSAVVLCEQVEQADASATERQAAAKIPEWRAAFDALGELPRAEARVLQNRFERAIELCKTRLAEQRAREAEQSFDNLFEATRRVHAYELAVLERAEPSACGTLKAMAKSFLTDKGQWPKGALKAITESLLDIDSRAGLQAAVKADLPARETALRILCIRAEIHHELPTPAEDGALRHQYQVQRLVHGMGQGLNAEEGDRHSMTLEWLRVGAISPGTYQNLEQRFISCWRRPQKTQLRR